MKTDRAELKRKARQALKGNYGTAIGGLLLYYVVYCLLAVAVEVAAVFLILAGGFAWGATASASVGDYAGGGSYLEFLLPILVMLGMYLAIGLFVFLMLPGVLRLFMNICKGEKAKATDIFWAFQHKPMKFAGISVGYGLILFVCSLPTMILSIGAALTGETMFAAVFNLVYGLFLSALSIYASLTFSMFFLILVEEPEKSWIQALAESRRLMMGNRLRYLGLGFSFTGWAVLGIMSFGVGMLWLIPYMSCTNVYFYLDLQPQIETIPPQAPWNPYMEEYEDTGREEVLEFTL